MQVKIIKKCRNEKVNVFLSNERNKKALNFKKYRFKIDNRIEKHYNMTIETRRI